MIFMAIQIPELGSGNGQTGDNELIIRQKYNANFNNQAHAASRLVGTAAGQVPLANDTLKAAYTAKASYSVEALDANLFEEGTLVTCRISFLSNPPPFIDNFVTISTRRVGDFAGSALYQEAFGYNVAQYAFRVRGYQGAWRAWEVPYTTRNTTKDSNGFLKGASPVVDLYSDKIDLNNDAIAQKQDITFERSSVGDYLVKGSLGFAQEGWHIETPKDANGNVLVAVVYKQLANNDLSIKTYAKRFDDETGDIVANLSKPRDIPIGRFISLRLHELPKEPPVMPDVDLDKED